MKNQFKSGDCSDYESILIRYHTHFITQPLFSVLKQNFQETKQNTYNGWVQMK